MKKLLLLVTSLIITYTSMANHLRGGWIYYEVLGSGSTAGTVRYRITVKQYLECNSTPQQVDQDVILGIFSANSNTLFRRVVIPKADTEIIQKTTFDPCISSPPTLCYRIDSYVTIEDLPDNTAGYVLTVQRCCRIAGIVNVSGSSQIGVSYSNTIPGTINGISFSNNNSPIFEQKDTAVICYNGSFTFPFGATDIDRDSLVYSFCEGQIGGNAGGNGAKPDPPSNPPYASVPYSPGYSSASPMGPGVTIDRKTGLISGIAPGEIGDYVIAVCVSEFRKGVLIGQTKKEIHVFVANCSLSAAALKPSYTQCDDFTMNFQNESTSSLAATYRWEFGDPASGANNVSTSPVPAHTYTDTGVFNLKLRVESGGGCKDSTTSIVKVYPGFNADFNITGSCFETPFQFTDRTTSRFGTVDSWSWDFGDQASSTDVSSAQSPNYKYPAPGQRTARLIVTNTKGCQDTSVKLVEVRDIPLLHLPFKDTLICSIDTLPLRAEGAGIFSWTPGYNIINPNTANPLVFPKDTTEYIVTLNENGCINSDTIRVNVLDGITVDVGSDTTICLTDSFILNPISHALQYSWLPASSLNDPSLKNPVATPTANTQYHVTARLGNCSATDSKIVRVAPYPQVTAGADVSICYGTVAQLNGFTNGGSFAWSPSSGLVNGNTLRPTATPLNTLTYTLTAFNAPNSGCPKPSVDSVVVNVVPKILAFAGNDTSIVANQPLQLNASGGTNYFWSPSTGLSSSTIGNPVAILTDNIETITYKVRVGTPEGCFAEDNINVRVFKTGPEIFVPTAFTPNNDGRNDVLRPLVVGMRSMAFFRVYNRWGQLLYATSETGKGWNGTFGGQEQPSGTYVFTAEAIDYEGKRVVKKGTTVLIR